MKLRLVYCLVAAAVGWGALAIQFYLLINYAIANGAPVITGVIKFFDYFTILSNILVATVFTTLALRSRNSWSDFFSHPMVKTGVAVYIFMTGLIYVLLLRNLWNPTGWQWVADGLLHYVAPILYGIEWLWFTPRRYLRWADALYWLIFPIGFGFWAMFWGLVIGFYPYPFINVAELGYPRVLINILLMSVGFIALGLLLVAIDRWLGKILPTSKQRAVLR